MPGLNRNLVAPNAYRGGSVPILSDKVVRMVGLKNR
jgi:hypothetical protein